MTGMRGAKGAHGFGHWWAQRVTAIALVPLTLWFVAGILGHVEASRADVARWLSDPVAAVLMILLLAAGLYHAVLGVGEVIVDYVPRACTRLASIILVRLAGALLAAAGIFAVLKLAFVG